MNRKEIVRQLGEAQLWIYEVAADKEEEHIQNMLKALEEAAEIISENT
jgi:hypothetical protein